MDFSHQSQSRTKISCKKYECLPSVDVLHKGLRRKISQKQYKSLYPRLRINQSTRANTITVQQNEFNEEHIYDEVFSMRQQNRQLQQENELLRTNIRRSNKINDLFQRRREDQQFHEMQFQKIVELKLLLQSEELEEEYSRCEHRWKATQKAHKNLKSSIKNCKFQSQINFINLLTEIGFEAGEMKNKNEQKLSILSEQLTYVKLKTRKLRQLLKSKMQESKKLTEQIDLQKKRLPTAFDSSISVSESGVMSLQIRNKSIDEIQTQIIKIKEQIQKFQEAMQNQIDSYVLAKIILYKEIDELKAQLVQKGVNSSRTVIN